MTVVFTDYAYFAGKGSIAPVCPTSFEFRVPDDAPLTLYPSVGTVKPGEVRINIASSTGASSYTRLVIVFTLEIL